MKLGISRAELLGWDEEEVELMLAYQSFMNEIGPNGERMSEATSPRADLNYYGEDRIRFDVTGPHVNQAEKRRLDEIDAWKLTAGENPNMNGLFWSVEKLDG